MYSIKRNYCPICSGLDLKLIYSIPYSSSEISLYLKEFYNKQGFIEYSYLEKFNFNLYKCNTCDFVFQNEVPSDFLLKKLYDEWINPELAKDRNSKFSREYYKEQFEELNLLIKYLNKPPYELKIFDFGLGWANWAKIAQSIGCKVYGCEISNSRQKNALMNNIIMINWDEIPKHKFDFINSEQVFEHLINPKETLNYLCQSLTEGGIIKISVPNAYNIEKLILMINWKDFQAINVFSPLEHINSFKQKSLIKLAKQNNLKTISINKKPWNIMHDSIIDFFIFGLKKIYRYLRYYKLKTTTLYFKKK